MFSMKRTNQRGFTLIELIVVCALLAILLGIAIPKLDTSDYDLKLQAKRLCNEIRNVRTLRMTEGEEYKVVLDRSSYRVQNGTKELYNVQLKANYRLLYIKNEIIFSYQGSPFYGGDTITVENIKNGRYMEITIVPASGRVLLKDEIHSSR